jgi:type VI secretion system secreted protein Hcp
MAVDMFLKVDGIKGEAPDDKHKDEIEVLSYSFGVSQSGTGSYGGGSGAGKANFQDFSFTHKEDVASPILFLRCATGEHIPSATFVARKAGGDKQEYLTIKLTDILVTSVSKGGSGSDEVPMEQVSMNYAKVEMDYKPQTKDGKLGAAVKSGYDLKLNKKV